MSYGTRITDKDAYLARHEGCHWSGEDKYVLEQALESRRFEIELYWKRTTYFWALIAAAFAGYFALETSGRPTMVVACIGLIVSAAWYLANRGSKYWQENWERHVDVLESKALGPLFKTTAKRRKRDWLAFWKGYPYSVSKLNQLVSLYVTTVWAGLIAHHVFVRFGWNIPRVRAEDIFLVDALIFGVLLLTVGLSGRQGKDRKIDFVESTLRSGAEEPES